MSRYFYEEKQEALEKLNFIKSLIEIPIEALEKEKEIDWVAINKGLKYIEELEDIIDGIFNTADVLTDDLDAAEGYC